MSASGYSCQMIGGVPVVTAPLEIDITTSAELRAILSHWHNRGHTTMVVDLAGTQFCDVAGLRELAQAHNRAVADGGGLRLVISADGALPRIFAVIGLDSNIPRFPTVTQALAESLSRDLRGNQAPMSIGGFLRKHEVMSGTRPSTRGTVLIAGAADVVVGVLKLAAGILVGSSAMLAEAAHSAADTLNQGLLLLSVHRGEREADARHPFGYGQERYFWSLLAAFGIFIAGAGFSVFEGVLALRRGGSENPLLAYVALAVSAVAEGSALARALIQLRSQARRDGSGILGQVRDSPDTTVKAALFEDSAAMAGLGLAALGLALRQVTGSPVWDGAASMAIGGLLVVVAFRLGLDSRDYLIGRAAGQEELAMIRAEIESAPGVDALLDLRTMYLGPDHLVVAARVAFDDGISADRAEDVADAVDRSLASRLSVVPHVFLDPTQISGSRRRGRLREDYEEGEGS